MSEVGIGSLSQICAVILCGGRGSRLGTFTENCPKPLLKIHDRPLLWYTVLTLYKQGFRHLILPLGYKGELIREFVRDELGGLDIRIDCIDTGESSSIAERLLVIKNYIVAGSDFFLVNGDTYFDFDIFNMYCLHRSRDALLTLSSVAVYSQYGLIIEEADDLVGFAREQRFNSINLDGGSLRQGYVNAGLVWLRREALDLIDSSAQFNFEHDLYPKIINMGRAAHFKIEGDWFAMDTPKDLNILNGVVEDSLVNIGSVVKNTEKDLASRYSYAVRYVPDVDDFWKSVLSKRVIPHQVELQPGPDAGRNICWLKCPYCYGGSAQDSGERLTLERYIEILRQIANGGVRKLIFAGYATDPLNYSGIDDLLQVPHDASQIFGFHTKALRFSDRFLDLLTSPQAEPLSYFSVSVDAGTNETYNRVHGVPTSKARLYDKVLANLRRIADARAKRGSGLDLSATYLVNGYNNSLDEVAKAISDLRNAGVDLVRFTFPQVPRGYGEIRKDDKNILLRSEVLDSYAALRSLVRDADGDKFRCLIMDLDSDGEQSDLPRTLPCFARFIFPTIGFDGWLSHCSESAAPHFRSLALGNLGERDFWDVFYDYSADDIHKIIAESATKMCQTGCRCDRKEHVVNSKLRHLGLNEI